MARGPARPGVPAMTCAGHGPVGNPGLESVRDRGLGSAADHSPAVPGGQGPGGLTGRDGRMSQEITGGRLWRSPRGCEADYVSSLPNPRRVNRERADLKLRSAGTRSGRIPREGDTRASGDRDAKQLRSQQFFLCRTAGNRREKKDAPQHRQEYGAPRCEGEMSGRRTPGASSAPERRDSRRDGTYPSGLGRRGAGKDGLSQQCHVRDSGAPGRHTGGSWSGPGLLAQEGLNG